MQKRKYWDGIIMLKFDLRSQTLTLWYQIWHLPLDSFVLKDSLLSLDPGVGFASKVSATPAIADHCDKP